MECILAIKRPFIWIKRLRNRCGYGVHSPFAFNFITNVIYEKTAYYAYNDIERSAEYRRLTSAKGKTGYSRKVNRLLFRLVNWAQPHTLLEVGDESAASFYFRKGRKECTHFRITHPDDFDALAFEYIDFMHIYFSDDIASLRCIFEKAANRTRNSSLFTIAGIYSSINMKQLWKEIKESKHTVITFDLYDIGIVCFDQTKNKQHYIVNF